MSVDPLTKKYAELTPYQFASNSPISGIDLDGLEFYYATDGKFLGQGYDSKNLEARLGKEDGLNQSGKKVITAVDINGNPAKQWVVIHNNNDEFRQLAAFGYNENTINEKSQQATQNVIINRTVNSKKTISKVMGGMAGSSVGTTHEKRMQNKKIFAHYADFINTDIKKVNSIPNMQSAVKGAINAFLNIDITGGAIYEKGSDFFTSTLRKNGTNWPDYIDFRDNGFKWAQGITLDKGTYNSSTLTDHAGDKSGGYKYIGTASYGKNTYMIDNPDFKEPKKEEKKN